MGRSPEVTGSRPAWPTWRNLISTKNIKISQASWQAPVVPATLEAEAEVLEPGRRRGGGCSELCHCTPTWVTEQDSVSKKKKYIYIYNIPYFCIQIGILCACKILNYIFVDMIIFLLKINIFNNELHNFSFNQFIIL